MAAGDHSHGWAGRLAARRPARERRLRRRLPAVAAATLVVFVTVAVSGLAGPADSDQRQLQRATLTLTHAASVPIPRSYLGLSTEYWALPLYERHLATFERVLGLIHVPGDGPMILRVGGDSADHAFWAPRLRAVPAWAFTLTPEWTELTAGIVHQLGVRLIIDLNLITDTPETGAVLPPALTRHNYLSDFRAYGSALRDVAPHLPLIGPAVAEPRSHWRWVRALLTSRPPGLSMISVHRYPYSGCVRRRSASFATVARVLSAHASTALAAQLAPMIAAAHRAGLPFRLTELNSVTCGGRPRVSDSFATALWAPDTLFALLRAGVDGVNLHVRANTINAPFAFTARGLFARPLLYGLIMFSRALAGGTALLPAHLQAPRHVHAWVVRTRSGALHILAINKGPRAVVLRLEVGAHGPATAEQLRAGSPSARFGVTLGGQRISPQGRWVGAPLTAAVGHFRRGYVVTLTRYGATLITLGQARNPARAAASPPATLAGLAPIS